MYTTATRPPRPSRINPEVLAEAVRLTGMKPREIVDVVDVEHGRIIYTADGGAVIVVPEDRPDGAGQTGVLFYPTARVQEPPRGARPFVDPDNPVVYGDRPDDGWTVEDLDTEAGRVQVPLPTATADPYGAWLTEDPAKTPVRARALWLKLATDNGLRPHLAAQRYPEAARCRKLVLDADWLATGEQDRL